MTVFVPDGVVVDMLVVARDQYGATIHAKFNGVTCIDFEAALRAGDIMISALNDANGGPGAYLLTGRELTEYAEQLCEASDQGEDANGFVTIAKDID